MRRSPAVEAWFKSYIQFFHLMEINGINPTKDFKALLSDKHGHLTLTDEEYAEYKEYPNEYKVYLEKEAFWVYGNVT